MLNQVNRTFSLHNKRNQRNIFATFFASMILTATIVLYVLHLMSFIRWCTESHANMQIKGKTWACFLLTSTNAFIFVEGQMIFGGIFLKINTFCVVVYFNNNDEFKFDCLLQISNFSSWDTVTLTFYVPKDITDWQNYQNNLQT